MLTEYTTYEEIRAVLGVADEELEDAVLAQPLFERQLILDLDDINTGLVDQFKTISAIDYATRSTAQKRFSTWCSSTQLMRSESRCSRHCPTSLNCGCKMAEATRSG